MSCPPKSPNKLNYHEASSEYGFALTVLNNKISLKVYVVPSDISEKQHVAMA